MPTPIAVALGFLFVLGVCSDALIYVSAWWLLLAAAWFVWVFY